MGLLRIPTPTLGKFSSGHSTEGPQAPGSPILSSSLLTEQPQPLPPPALPWPGPSPLHYCSGPARGLSLCDSVCAHAFQRARMPFEGLLMTCPCTDVTYVRVYTCVDMSAPVNRPQAACRGLSRVGLSTCVSVARVHVRACCGARRGSVCYLHVTVALWPERVPRAALALEVCPAWTRTQLQPPDISSTALRQCQVLCPLGSAVQRRGRGQGSRHRGLDLDCLVGLRGGGALAAPSQLSLSLLPPEVASWILLVTLIHPHLLTGPYPPPPGPGVTGPSWL